MAIELKFYKSDDSPWGFRLTGGADCDVPITVIKVVEGSIADANGLQVGDVIVRINNNCITDCTHIEVHELISEAGQELIFGIRRDYYTQDDDETDENNNLEVSNIMGGSFEQSAEITTVNGNTNYRSSTTSITDDLIAEAISGQAEVLPEQNILGVNFNKVDLSQSTILKVMEDQRSEEAIELKERKWSAFLQKPQRPVIKPKPRDVEQPKAPPYKVVIKKQKKKNIAIDTKTFSPEPEQEPEPEPQENQNEEDTNFDNNVENLEISENEENFNEDDVNKDSENEIGEVDTESVVMDDDEDEINKTEKYEEVELSVDEQLAQVRMQLQALAQLPSSVQDNLEMLTKQLTKILNVTQLHNEEEQNLDSARASRGDSLERSFEETLDTKDEVEYSEEEREADVNDEEEYKSNISETSDRHSDFNYEDDAQEVEEDVEVEENFEPEINEEELERLRIESEKIEQKERNVSVLEESHQRRLEQRPTNPLAPVQRPIILPGGRKWAQPDDALPVRKKKSSMPDEKIIETLDTYSEIIVGHTKGINFLKYQPPPKNLDYLQKSEVYKLIHDMDPPPRGIATRPEIVASEQDYYTKGQ